MCNLICIFSMLATVFSMLATKICRGAMETESDCHFTSFSESCSDSYYNPREERKDVNILSYADSLNRILCGILMFRGHTVKG